MQAGRHVAMPSLRSAATALGRALRGQLAAAPEDRAVEQGDQQRHEHAHKVVGGAAPVRQPELARQRHELGEPRGRILPRHPQLHRQGCKISTCLCNLWRQVSSDTLAACAVRTPPLTLGSIDGKHSLVI